MSNAVTKVRNFFELTKRPMTLMDIRIAQPDLKSSQISMALCYFIRQRYMTREQVSSEQKAGRKKVWRYTFYLTKLPRNNS